MYVIDYELKVPQKHMVGNAGHVAFAYWQGETTLEAVAAIGPAMKRASRFRETIALVTMIGPKAPPPSFQILRAINSALQDPQYRVQAMAVWLNGGSFINAKRAAIFTCLTVVRLRFDHQTFEQLQPASAWIARQLGEPEAFGVRLEDRLEAIAREAQEFTGAPI